MCKKEGDEILQCHVKFARFIAQRIDASKSQYTVNAGQEAKNLARDINHVSGLLSTNAERMAFELDSFVRGLRKIQVKVEKEQSLAERSLLKPIARIFATLTPSTSGTARHCPDSKVLGGALADTSLREAASVFRVMDSGAS